ncbi:hypothetical protein [Eggerthella sinensis]|uniref:hypothetical protein n=1 Tax=Eggerthella sinensis TaxID=242230 RepID=UPI00248D7A15|nr:hypothetical protein [Eggerthella sinensis]
MKRKVCIVSIVAVLALAVPVAGCAPSSESSANTSSDATTHANPKFISADDVDNSYASYLELRSRLDEASSYTEQYGDSNPHTNIHGASLTCENCHNDDAGMTQKEDMVCKDCHAWPRELQSDITAETN